MTRRERMERRAEQLREWAHKREVKATAVFKAGEPFTSDIAFNTQPGHIPFRARLIAREDRAHESLAKAASMTTRAAGIEGAVDRSIFSDDADAIEQLETRIREREAVCARVVELNKALRRELKAGAGNLLPGALERIGATAEERERMIQNARFHGSPLYPGYANGNMRNLIRADRERIESIKRQAARRSTAEENGGKAIQRFPDSNWCQVTFAEKPARAILDALKAAGYAYSRGTWCGYLDKLPAEVEQA